MSNIREMRQKYHAYYGTVKAILDTAMEEKRCLTPTEKKDIEGLEAKMLDLRETLKKHDEIRDLGDELKGKAPQPGAGVIPEGRSLEAGEVLGLSREQRMTDYVRSQGGESEPLSLGKAVRGMLLGDWSGAEAERRSMSEATGGLGGWLVSPGLSARVIDLARNMSVCVKAGARTVPMEEPEITVVKVKTDPTAYWRAEHKDITESDMGFTPIKLKAQALGCLCRVSLELLEDAKVLSTTVENAIAQAIALELDRAGLLGSGVGEPLGVYNTDGVQVYSMGTNGAALTSYDPFSYAVEAIANYNGIANAVCYSPRTAGALDRLKDKNDQPLQAPESFRNLMKLASNQIPNTQKQGTATNASCAIVGDFGQMLIGMRTRLVLEASRFGDSDSAKKMQALIRGYLRADVAVLRPTHFDAVKGIIPA